MLLCTSPSEAQTYHTTLSATLTVGASPFAMAVNSTTRMVYVVNVGNGTNGTVSAIDETTNLITTIPVGNTSTGIAVNQTTNMVYVINDDDETLSVINGATNTVTATVNLPSYPNAVAVNPMTNTVYVTSSYGTVYAIDGMTYNITAMNTGSNPVAIAVNQLSNTIYVANEGSNSVTVIAGPVSTQTMSSNATVTTTTTPAAVTGTINVGVQPVAIDVNPGTNMVYVANQGSSTGSGTVTVINAGSGNTTATIAVNANPLAIAVNPVSNYIYVAEANAASPTVSVINGTNNAVTPLTVLSSPKALAINQTTNETYVAGSPYLTVIGANNQTSTPPESINGNPNAVAVDPATDKIYMTNNVLGLSSPNGTVAVIAETQLAFSGAVAWAENSYPESMAVNPGTQTVYVGIRGPGSGGTLGTGTVNVIQESNWNGTPQTVSIGEDATAVAVNPVTNTIYVADAVDNYVTVINGATLATGSVATQSTPSALAINSQTDTVYVLNSGSNSVTVIDGLTNAVSATITLPSTSYYPCAVALNQQTNMVYVADCGTAMVVVINGATNTVAATVNLPLVIYGATPSIAVNEATNMFYVGITSFGIGSGGTLSVINGATNAFVKTISIGQSVPAVVVNPLTNLVYVADSSLGVVTAVDGATYAITGTFSLPGANALTVDTIRNKIYVNTGNAGGGSLAIIDGGRNTTGMIQLSGSSYVTPSPVLVVDPITGNVFAASSNSGGSSSLVAYQSPLAQTTGSPAQDPALADMAELLQPDRLPPPPPPLWPAPYVGPGSNKRTHTVLLIHGREQDSDGQQIGVNGYGGFTWDQSGHWQDGPPATGARQTSQLYTSQVIYVQWDSWFSSFDDMEWPGGWFILNQVFNQYCQYGISENGTSDGCSVICHSAGCAALEYWLANSDNNDPNTYISFDQIMEASSAASGSELCDWEQKVSPSLEYEAEVILSIADGQPVQFAASAPIDPSITTTYARADFDHNDMYGAPFMTAIAGTAQEFPNQQYLYELQWTLFPSLQMPSPATATNWNQNCNFADNAILGHKVECHDTLVGLASTCGHSQPGAYFGCDNYFNPGSNIKTYSFHTYWGGWDFSGQDYATTPTPPYSQGTLGGTNTHNSDSFGQWNPYFNTYEVDHSGGKKLAVQEYGWCNLTTQAVACE